ncbi:DEAD/DEAH box helicase [Salegentibacter mishustinae]|uniref:DEAD/DEAH box helicase n=1 Tax=Salegentibacter mishustinae TaxID=270918 RepID=UPI001CE0658F|nr:DEAD/DEAH box helicase [Salegentibacter mishustinae]UBZ06996.1 DEAD/DEAH box helicase [Salegentibacter mishustinae]
MIVQEGDIYNAVISYVGDKMNHGYVVLVDKLEDLNREFIYDRNRPSFKFHPAKDTAPEKWQLVEVQIVKKKYGKIATITRNTYFGLKEDGEVVNPVGEFLREKNQLEIRKPEEDYPALEVNAPVDFFLYYDERRRRLLAANPAGVANEESFYEELKSDFTHFTNQLDSKGIIKAGEIAPLLLKRDRGELLVKYQLDFLIKNLEAEQNAILSQLFIGTFINLNLEKPDTETCIRLLGGDSLALVRLWLKKDLPVAFLDPKAIKKWHLEQQLFNKLEPKEFVGFFQKIQDFKEYSQLLEFGLESLENISEQALPHFNKLIKFADNQNNLRSILYQNLAFDSLLDLWRKEEISEIPGERLKENFSSLKEEDRIKYLQQTGWPEYLKLVEEKESSQVIIENYFEHFKEYLKKEINYCCFDLEVNPQTKKIEELAFRNNKEIFEELDPTADDIRQLKNAVERADVVIGQNIRAFDLEKLYGDEVPDLVIWDSLEIESIVRPDAHSLALNTEHYALEDVEHTLSLFYYQLYRILGDESLRKSIKNLYNFHFLEDHQAATIPYLKIKDVAIEKPVKKLFHSEVSGINKVVGTMVPKTAGLVLCPEPFWPHFRDDANYHFEAENHLYSLSLERAKWEEKLADLAFLRTSLDQFHKSCETKGHNPYVRLLSSYLVQQIQEHFPIEQICTPLKSLGNKSIVSEWDFEKNSEALLKGRSEKEVVQLGSDLWPFTSKRNFGEFTQQELSVTEEGNALWVRFSNGRSYAPISKKLAEGLANEVSGDHFWVERESLDKYILWGSNAGVLDERFARVKAGDFYTKDSGLNSKDARFIKYSNNASSRLMDLNPETLYRDKYWDVKLKTLIQLLGSGRLEKDKCVLIVSRPEEVDTLTKIIRKLGDWFSPSLKSNLRRRLERLVEEENGIMVVAQEDFEQLLSYPLSEGILYVIESLSPEELVEISGINRANELTASIEDEEGDTESEGMELPHLSSVAGSMARLNKYYDWMMFRMALQHQQNELLVMDPRANSSLFDSFKCKALPVDFKEIVEGKSRVFEIIRELTSSWLYAPREFEYGNLQEHLDRISAALIDGYAFKPEQKDYLDIIFPAKDDVLVTLPTGVGKSVLFQGPALYRSSFTGKMSIVVTPLKALMEDHVMGLWKKGFWNGVEYINADKGAEVKDIYRKIAGGQLLMVFVTPERFRSKGFVWALEQRMKIDGGLEYFIFDEAHCISQWGSEFRPDYFYCAQQVKKIRNTYPAPLLLLSATVTKQVASHLEHALYEEV